MLSELEKVQIRGIRTVGKLIAFSEKKGWYGAFRFNPQPLHENQRYSGQFGGHVLYRATKEDLLRDLITKVLEDHQ